MRESFPTQIHNVFYRYQDSFGFNVKVNIVNKGSFVQSVKKSGSESFYYLGASSFHKTALLKMFTFIFVYFFLLNNVTDLLIVLLTLFNDITCYKWQKIIYILIKVKKVSSKINSKSFSNYTTAFIPNTCWPKRNERNRDAISEIAIIQALCRKEIIASYDRISIARGRTRLARGSRSVRENHARKARMVGFTPPIPRSFFEIQGQAALLKQRTVE